MAWIVFAIELALFIRYRVHAAAFFVYPLVLMLLTVSAVVHEPFAQRDVRRCLAPLHRAHSSSRPSAWPALFIGLAFSALAWAQDRALKSKTARRAVGLDSEPQRLQDTSAIARSPSASRSTPSASLPGSSGRTRRRPS